MRTVPGHLAVAGLVAAVLTGEALAQAPSPTHTLVPKVSVYSEYEVRGISQTAEDPALQLNLDYTHVGGLYLGLFASNIKWLKEAGNAGAFSTDAVLEVDLIGGYRFKILEKVTGDAGYIRYQYPSSGAFSTSPNTDEVYFGVAAGPFSAKYSLTLGNLFGFANSSHSTFAELNLSREVLPRLTATAQVAHQTVKNNAEFSYAVYKLGASYAVGSAWAASLYLKNTDAKSASYTVQGKDLGKARLVAFVSRAF